MLSSLRATVVVSGGGVLLESGERRCVEELTEA
jgi:hypothetical protein